MTALKTAPGAARPPRRFVRWYTGASLLLLNTLVLFIVLNLVLWGANAARKALRERASVALQKQSADALRKVYAPMTEQQWKQLGNETYFRPFDFEPYTQIKEAPCRGTYVNVAEEGYGLVPNQGPWPIDPKNFNIFAFGGSTMFGWGVADDQTVPARIQEILAAGGVANKKVCVYNFGRGYFYSTPERILFEQLLAHGARPDLAIFMDGLNDFYHVDDVLDNTPQLSRAMEASSTASAPPSSSSPCPFTDTISNITCSTARFPPTRTSATAIRSWPTT